MAKKSKEKDTSSDDSKEWKSKSLKEIKISESALWRAQLSTSPDGKKFIGVRKFHQRKDGRELPGKAYISLQVPADKEEVVAELNSLSALFKFMAEHLEKPAEKGSGAREVERPTWAICREIEGEDVFLRARVEKSDGTYHVKRTDVEEDAMQFGKEKDAEKWLKSAKKTGLNDAWEVRQLN